MHVLTCQSIAIPAVSKIQKPTTFWAVQTHENPHAGSCCRSSAAADRTLLFITRPRTADRTETAPHNDPFSCWPTACCADRSPTQLRTLRMEDIKLQPVNQMQQVQAPGQENLPKEQQEKLPSYSERYYDDFFEYRHVSLTIDQAQRLPKPMRILSELEWRSLGVQQSKGWVHYAVHRPEPHVLLFRRPKYYGTENEVSVPRHLLDNTNTNGANQNRAAN